MSETALILLIVVIFLAFLATLVVIVIVNPNTVKLKGKRENKDMLEEVSIVLDSNKK